MPLICALVPVKVGFDTVPEGVPLTETFPSVPVNDAVYELGTAMFPVTSLTPVPVKAGALAVYAPSPVFTVVFDPFVGSVPALQPNVRTSFATVAVKLGRVPTAVMEFTVVVEPAVARLIVGAATEPLGVYVAVPEDAGETVAVLFDVAFVETLTLPDGVNVPVEVVAEPVNVG